MPITIRYAPVDAIEGGGGHNQAAYIHDILLFFAPSRGGLSEQWLDDLEELQQQSLKSISYGGTEAMVWRWVSIEIAESHDQLK